LTGLVCAQRTAQTFIKVAQRGVRSNLWIARHTERLELIVGEDRMGAVGALGVQMTGGAVTAAWVIEQRQSPQFLRAQFGCTLEEAIELARERMEARIVELEALEGPERPRVGSGRIVEDSRAEQLAKVAGIGGALQLGGNIRWARIRHLVGREQRKDGLVAQRLEATVPAESACRRLVALQDAVRRARDVLLAPDGRTVQRIAQRRHGARALQAQAGPAELHGTPIGRPIGMRRAVAARAGEPAGSRQGGIEEYQLAERREIGCTRPGGLVGGLGADVGDQWRQREQRTHQER